MWALCTFEQTKIAKRQRGTSMSYKQGVAAALWISGQAGLEVNLTLLFSYPRYITFRSAHNIKYEKKGQLQRRDHDEFRKFSKIWKPNE